MAADHFVSGTYDRGARMRTWKWRILKSGAVASPEKGRGWRRAKDGSREDSGDEASSSRGGETGEGKEGSEAGR